MKVIIIEDEKPSARRLQRMLSSFGIEVETMLHSVATSIEWFLTNPHPDLILLDIQLSDGIAFEIFEEVKVESAIIFTTAYDEYALKAFKLNSVDYILKPIDLKELELAIHQFKTRQLGAQHLEVDLERIRTLIGNPLNKNYKKRFSIQVGQHLKIIPVDEIECIYSENKATYIYTKNKRSYLLDKSLDELSNDLDPMFFYRVNRQFYVYVSAIKDIVSYTNSRLKLILNTYTDKEIVVSREKVKSFKQWLS